MLTKVWKGKKAQEAQNGELLFVSTDKGTELAIKLNYVGSQGTKSIPLFLILARSGQQDAFNIPVLRYAQDMTDCTSLGTEWFLEPDVDSLSIYKGEVIEGTPAYKAAELGNHFLFQNTEGYLYYALDPTITRVFGSAAIFPRCFRISDRSLDAGDAQQGYLALKHWRIGLSRTDAPDEHINPVDWLVSTRNAPWPQMPPAAQTE